ncbi:hypothetical protein ADK82_32270 [Streptomyces sp. NRRL S-4]|nr:hypothetical protein ADK82_32270 [Streptomyces sp. NRRL S-4]
MRTGLNCASDEARLTLPGGEFGLSQYQGLILVAVGTLVGTWLGRRRSHRSTMLLGAASGVLPAVAGADRPSAS